MPCHDSTCCNEGSTLSLMPSVVHAFAPAKVNLALSVGPLQRDGMHEIASWMTTLDLCDDLTLTRLPLGTCSRYAIEWHTDARSKADIDWPVRSDLAVRAHEALEARLARRLPVQLRLQKRIPVGGGLGGGSSNAAAMLRGLDALFELRLRPEFLEEVARPLGSDVPFFVRGGSAIVELRGEQLQRARDQRVHVVLVFPQIACPTGAVYRAFDALTRTTSVDVQRVRALTASSPASSALFNDLAEAACIIAPQLTALRGEIAVLTQQPVHVSGSGSTLFLLADDAMHADALAQLIERTLSVVALASVSAPTPIEIVDGDVRAIDAISSDRDDEDDVRFNP